MRPMTVGRLGLMTAALSALFLAAGEASAQSSSDTLVIPELDRPVELDGRLDEAAWRQARRFRPVQHRPNFGAEPTEETEYLIGYTEDYVYAACRCGDVGELSVPSFQRDYFTRDTDFFGLLLDTYNDNENALTFFTTPAGLRTDAAVSNDASSLAYLDPNWNTFWNVETRRSEEGWTAEMRIPVSSLRFDAEGGRATMGLSLLRLVARKPEEIVFPEIPPDWGLVSPFKPSQAQDVVFENLEPEPPLRVTPYLLGGFGQRNVLNDSETAYRRETDPAHDAGLDVKFGVTSNLTLDLTVNTDFAQVEADDQQVNLTRFPLFFPEKRRFFQERASNFSFGFGRPNRLFYSRRIGLHQGEQVRILGGARLVGRAGPWDVGVLNMQTAREPDIGGQGEALPSENFGVVRLRRKVLNEDSNVGGIVTNRVRADGSYNLAYGMDGLIRVAGQNYVTARWAQTFEDGSPDRVSSLEPSRVHFLWENRSYEGFNYDLRYDRAGQRYRPAVGLELRDDYFRLGDRVGYGWIPGEESSINRHQVSVTGQSYLRNADHSLQSLQIGPQWEVDTNTGHSLTMSASRRTEDLREGFALSETADVPAGRYDFHEGRLRYSMPAGEKLRTSVEVRGGSFYDGHRLTAQAGPTWNASRHLRLNGFYQWNRISFPDRGQDFTAHLGRLRAEVTPSVEYSILGFIQYNSARDVAVANLRFRYNPGEGNDLYLVFNERLSTDRGFVRPRPPRSSQRAVLLKYTYTFDW